MRPTTLRPTTRRLAMVSMLAFAGLALAGCLNVDADVNVHSDATASGSLAISVDKRAALLLGITSADSLQEQLQSSEDMELGNATCEAGEDGDVYVIDCAFTNATFDEGTDDLWSIERVGDTVVMHVTGQGGDASVFGDSSLGGIVIDATFPGPVLSMTGDHATQESENTVRIEAGLSDSLDVTITADAAEQPPLSPLEIGLMVLTLLVVVGLVMATIGRSTAPDHAETHTH